MREATVQIIIAVLTYAVTQLARYVQRTRFWKRVEANAARYLADPRNPIDDPREAAQLALVEAQRPQLSEIERHIEQGIERKQ